jgi:hypothetical protein
MSETEGLNSNGDSRPNPEQTLEEIPLEPLRFNRDELFFRAGYASGSTAAQSSRARLLWPTAAAALLTLSLGLSAAVVHQAHRLQIAQTTAESRASPIPASTDTSTLPQIATDIAEPPFAARQMRDWQRLASPGPLPPGHLTAMGWSESHENPPTTDDNEAPSLPRRAPTYFELLQSYREG